MPVRCQFELLKRPFGRTQENHRKLNIKLNYSFLLSRYKIEYNLIPSLTGENHETRQRVRVRRGKGDHASRSIDFEKKEVPEQFKEIKKKATKKEDRNKRNKRIKGNTRLSCSAR